VAVLTSALTASAGEAVALAFVGRPRTTLIGEPTLGLTSFNVAHAMPDGALLIVTSELDVDRNGKPYDGPIPVDQHVAVDWSRVATDDDPVLVAALAWLATQPSCAA
jgi:C-terminal processing protease CtpA/Prc